MVEAVIARQACQPDGRRIIVILSVNDRVPLPSGSRDETGDILFIAVQPARSVLLQKSVLQEDELLLQKNITECIGIAVERIHRYRIGAGRYIDIAEQMQHLVLERHSIHAFSDLADTLEVGGILADGKIRLYSLGSMFLEIAEQRFAVIISLLDPVRHDPYLFLKMRPDDVIENSSSDSFSSAQQVSLPYLHQEQ